MNVNESLQYIIDSPAPEHGGFHPTTVEIARAALAHIAQLERDLAESRAQVADKQKLIELHCRDWADTDTEVKRICGVYGVRDDDIPGEFKCMETCVEELADMLKNAKAEHYALAEKNTELERRNTVLIIETDRLDAIRRQQEQDNLDLIARVEALEKQLADLKPFVLEDYYPDCAASDYKAEVCAAYATTARETGA